MVACDGKSCFRLAEISSLVFLVLFKEHEKAVIWWFSKIPQPVALGRLNKFCSNRLQKNRILERRIKCHFCWSGKKK